jgi:hypothetical protein
MLKKFDEMKMNCTYSEYPDGYTWPVRKENLCDFVPLLFQ